MQKHQTMGVSVLKRIGEETVVSISFLIVIAGGIFWLAAMYSKVEASVVRLDSLEVKQSSTDREIIDRLARIEEQMKYFKKENQGE